MPDLRDIQREINDLEAQSQDGDDVVKPLSPSGVVEPSG